jgi:hypothetical protein
MDGGVELLCILVCCVQCFLSVLFMYMKGGLVVGPTTIIRLVAGTLFTH